MRAIQGDIEDIEKEIERRNIGEGAHELETRPKAKTAVEQHSMSECGEDDDDEEHWDIENMYEAIDKLLVDTETEDDDEERKLDVGTWAKGQRWADMEAEDDQGQRGGGSCRREAG
eukprot:TRINITY_DN111397_c0_g1_i1.p4 TRINITY_DN111397_c0_g1~~TRINITY_DN111397_c0_g1_i1.p4  ORF type:complete len:116 (+),score=24.31 TRINITY_DN111397_c0_g1_i1:548-895(+)